MSSKSIVAGLPIQVLKLYYLLHRYSCCMRVIKVARSYEIESFLFDDYCLIENQQPGEPFYCRVVIWPLSG